MDLSVASGAWFPYSVGATACFGVMMALYKLPSAKQVSRSAVTLWMLTVQAMLALLFFHGSFAASTPQLIALAAVWASAFVALTLLQMYALTHLETSVMLPITSAGSLMVTVTAAFLLFDDPVSVVQLAGMLLGIIAVFEFLWRAASIRLTGAVLAVGGGIMVIGALTKVLQRVVAGSLDVYAFQLWQYLFGVIVALLVLAVVHRRSFHRQFSPIVLGVGTAIGALSFGGGVLLYEALQRGSFPLITTLHSTYIFVSALAAWWLFGEQLTNRKLVLLALAIVAAILMKIG